MTQEMSALPTHKVLFHFQGQLSGQINSPDQAHKIILKDNQAFTVISWDGGKLGQNSLINTIRVPHLSLPPVSIFNLKIWPDLANIAPSAPQHVVDMRTQTDNIHSTLWQIKIVCNRRLFSDVIN